MALQKVNRNLLNTGVSDSSDATAITIDSSENVTFSGTVAATSVDASAGFLNGSNGGIRIHTGGTKFFNITAANAARDNHMDIGASDARFKALYLGDKIYLGGLTLTSNDAGRIGLNRNPDDGTSVNSGSLQRYQVNGPYSGGDYLDFQNYDSSGNYLGGFRVDGGAIRAEPLGVSTPSYSFDNDTDTGMTRPTADTLQFVCGGTVKNRISSDGLLFNSYTAAANALDDYEEGTWTPVLIGSDSQSGQVYSTQQGTYTKIGRQVNCQFNLNLSTEGSFGNNYILLSGFPFAISSSVNTVHLGNLYFVGMAANYISIGLQAFEGYSKAYLWAKKSATASREYVGTTDLADSTQLTGQFTYFI